MKILMIIMILIEIGTNADRLIRQIATDDNTNNTSSITDTGNSISNGKVGGVLEWYLLIILLCVCVFLLLFLFVFIYYKKLNQGNHAEMIIQEAMNAKENSIEKIEKEIEINVDEKPNEENERNKNKICWTEGSSFGDKGISEINPNDDGLSKKIMMGEPEIDLSIIGKDNDGSVKEKAISIKESVKGLINDSNMDKTDNTIHKESSLINNEEKESDGKGSKIDGDDEGKKGKIKKKKTKTKKMKDGEKDKKNKEDSKEIHEINEKDNGEIMSPVKVNIIDSSMIKEEMKSKEKGKGKKKGLSKKGRNKGIALKTNSIDNSQNTIGESNQLDIIPID